MAKKIGPHEQTQRILCRMAELRTEVIALHKDIEERVDAWETACSFIQGWDQPVCSEEAQTIKEARSVISREPPSLSVASVILVEGGR